MAVKFLHEDIDFENNPSQIATLCSILLFAAIMFLILPIWCCGCCFAECKKCERRKTKLISPKPQFVKVMTLQV